ncbi:MAG: cytochrome c [Terriglobales bacterium]
MRILGKLGGVYLTVVLLAGVGFCASDGQGASVYRARCGNCHGADGTGKGRTNLKMKVPDLTSKQVQSQSDEQLYESIAQGKRHREYPHAFLYTGLTKQQIEAVVAFMRTFK